MLGTPFYHNILRKTVIGFGTIFNNIYLRRREDPNDENSAVSEQIKVPLYYGSKQKWYKRITSTSRDDDLRTTNKIVLPIMAFEMSSVNYDSSRKTSGLYKRAKSNNDTSVMYRYNSIPYTVDFSLSIMVKNLDDGLQILEQILPFFQPEYTVGMNFSELNEDWDMNVTIQGQTFEDSFEGSLADERVLIINLTFKANIVLIGPIRESKVITRIDTNFYDFDSEERLEQMTIEPPVGATAGTDLTGLTGFNITINTWETGLTN